MYYEYSFQQLVLEQLFIYKLKKKTLPKLQIYTEINSKWIIDLNTIFRFSEQTCGCQGEGKGVGWTGSMGLIDANYCIWNR